MSEDSNLPVLTDLIERGDEITMADLGLDEDSEPEIEAGLTAESLDELSEIDPFVRAALEQSIRRVLDEHLELAMQEIKLIIQRELNKPK